MKKTILMLTGIIFVSIVSAKTTYRGLVVAHIVEPNGHVYRGYNGFTNSGEFEDKQVIYFSQERGQQISLSKTNLLIDSTTANKYHMLIEMLDRKDDKFKAELSFFENTMEYQDAEKDYQLISKIIKRTVIEGTLNSENNFTFVDDNQPNLKVRMNIDRIFTKEEILKRLKAKSNGNKH